MSDGYIPLPAGYIEIPAGSPLAETVLAAANQLTGRVTIEIQTGDAVIFDEQGLIVDRYILSVADV